jgi:hypothetical protein
MSIASITVAYFGFGLLSHSLAYRQGKRAARYEVRMRINNTVSATLDSLDRIPSTFCLNLAAAVNVVLYDRVERTAALAAIDALQVLRDWLVKVKE